MTEAVLDSGPLIHLSKLGALDVMSDLNLFIPDAVWEEVARHQPSALKHSKLHLRRVSAPAPSAELHALVRALALDRGEVESLSLLETHPNAIFLTDDAAARLAAEQRGHRTHGSIGLLIRSVRQGRNKPDQVLALVRALPQRSTLFIRHGLLQAIVERLEKEWTKKD